MPQFRKKPVVIEAFQFNPPTPFTDAPAWLSRALLDGVAWYQGGDAPYLTIRTLEGDHRADVGDWIIQGIKGELYPCKPDIFAATYDPA